jgi:mgtE-like transporter
MAFTSRARRLWAYWRAEQRTFRQGLVALTLSTAAGFVAGLTLAHLTHTLAALPGLLVLIPAAVGVRGSVFGAIGARLGTANAAGLLTIDLHRGGILRQNVDAAILSTLSSSLWIAVLARIATLALGQPSISVADLVMISVVGGALGSAVVLAITIALSALSHRLGWDLDSVSTPMVTAMGDMTTLPSLFVATLLVHNDVIATVAEAVSALVAGVAVVRSFTARGAVLRRIVLELTVVTVLTSIFDLLSGSFQQERLAELAAVPVLLSLIPPFVSQAGALGGIFSSRITSKLQLGVITPRGRPEPPAVVDGVIVSALAIVVFTLIGAIAWILGTVTGLKGMPAAGTLIRATLIAGVIVTPITIATGYYLAVVTTRFGLDPDNQGIPTITSVMDLAGVAVVLLVMTSLGVLPHG